MIHKRKMNLVHKLSGEEFKKIDHLFSSSLYVVSQPFQLIKSKAIFKRLQDTVVNRKKCMLLMCTTKMILKTRINGRIILIRILSM